MNLRLAPAEPDFQPQAPMQAPELPQLDINALRKGLFGLLSPVISGRQGKFTFPEDIQSDPRFPGVIKALSPDIEALGLTIGEDDGGVSIKDPSNDKGEPAKEMPSGRPPTGIQASPVDQGGGRLGASPPASLMEQLGSSPGLMSRLAP